MTPTATPTGTATSLPVIPAPTGLQGAWVAWDQVDLVWNDNATNESGYYVERSISSPPLATTFGLRATLPANSTSYVDHENIAYSSVSYRIRAFNGNNSSFGATLELNPALRPPRLANVSMRGETEVDLSWVDYAYGEAGFVIDRSTSPDPSTFIGIGFADADMQTYRDSSGVEENTTYYYSVRTIDASASANSLSSNVLNVTTPLLAPVGFSAQAASYNQIHLQWINRSQVADRILIQRATDFSGPYSNLPQSINASQTIYVDRDLSPQTTYYYRIHATAASYSQTSSLVTAFATTLSAPPPPTNFAARAVSSARVDLTWNLPNGCALCSGTPHIRLVHSTSYNGTYTPFAGSPPLWITMSAIDKGLPANTTYYYKIGIEDDWGVGLYSDPISATTLPDPLTQSIENVGTAYAYDAFGKSVAISGDIAVVGSPAYSIGNTSTGAVMVFRRSGGSWINEAVLYSSSSMPGDQFGATVAIDGLTIVVGAPLHDNGNNDPNNDSGAAYIFAYDGSYWTQWSKIVAGDKNAGDRFGSSVAVSGQNIVVGAPLNDYSGKSDAGAAYIFKLSSSSGNWVQDEKFTPSTLVSGDLFGSSVSVKDQSLAVGAPGSDSSTIGSVYLFRKGNSWQLETQLQGGTANNGDAFGYSLAMDTDRLVVGMPELFSSAVGRVYVFQFTSGQWTNLAMLTGDIGVSSGEDRFGFSVGVLGNRVIVGAPRDEDRDFYSGAAYLFTLGTTNWSRSPKIVDDALQFGDSLGWSVAISASEALIGMPTLGQAGAGSGRVHILPY